MPKRRSGGGGGGRGMPGWVGAILGLSAGLFVAVLIYLGHGRPITTAMIPAPSTEPPPKPAAPAAVPVPPKTPSRYTFYQMLPSYEVVIPPEEAAKVKKGKPLPPELAAPGTFVIQVGAYRTQGEADQARANLALLGVESRIEQVTIDPTNIWYRVRVGPEPSAERAKELLERLQKQGVQAMLIKVKN
jgi:cell division protein FtsN